MEQTIKHICPNCGNGTFITVAHVTQSWKVDAFGNFIQAVSQCDEVTHGPDNGNIWTCSKCGAESIMVEKKEEEKLQDNFKCRAEVSGSCKQWLRECVAWENCQLKSYGAPCPNCVASSPLEHQQCNGCMYQKWKKDNYCEE